MQQQAFFFQRLLFQCVFLLLARPVRSVDAFFRTPARNPLRAAAAMRLGFALIVLYDRLVYWHDLDFLYSPVDGVLKESAHSRNLLRKYPSYWDDEDNDMWTLASPLALFKHSTPSTDHCFVKALFWLGVGHGLCLVLIDGGFLMVGNNAGFGNFGYISSKQPWRFFLLRLLQHPSLHVFGILVTIVSFQNRGINMLHDMQDTLMLLVSFYMLWLPTEACNNSWNQNNNGNENNQSPHCPMWPFRLIQIQTCCIYLGAGFAKLCHEDGQWVPGDDDSHGGLTAMHYLVHQQDFFGGLFRPRFLFGFSLPLRVATLSSLVLECTCWFLVWIPQLRVATTAAMVVFHLGIELAMNIHIFQWLSILCWSSFLVVPEEHENENEDQAEDEAKHATTMNGNPNNEAAPATTNHHAATTTNKKKRNNNNVAKISVRRLLRILVHTLFPLALATSVVLLTFPHYILVYPPLWWFLLEEKYKNIYNNERNAEDAGPTRADRFYDAIMAPTMDNSCPKKLHNNQNNAEDNNNTSEEEDDEEDAITRADWLYDTILAPKVRTLTENPVLTLAWFWKFWGIDQWHWSMYGMVQTYNIRVVAKVVLKNNNKKKKSGDDVDNEEDANNEVNHDDNESVFYFSSPEWTGPKFSASTWERKKRYRQILFWNAVNYEPTVQHDICKRWGKAAVSKYEQQRRMQTQTVRETQEQPFHHDDGEKNENNNNNDWQDEIDHVVLKQLSIMSPPPLSPSSFWEPVVSNRNTFLNYEESLLYVYVPGQSSLPEQHQHDSHNNAGNNNNGNNTRRDRSRNRILYYGTSNEFHDRYDYNHGWDFDEYMDDGGVWWDERFYRYSKTTQEYMLDNNNEDYDDSDDDEDNDNDDGGGDDEDNNGGDNDNDDEESDSDGEDYKDEDPEKDDHVNNGEHVDEDEDHEEEDEDAEEDHRHTLIPRTCSHNKSRYSC